MSRKSWSADPNEIMEAITALIDGQLPVTLQRKGARPLQSQLLSVHSHRQIPYILMARPAGLKNAYEVRDLLFKLEGAPILGFSCPVTRESDTMLATMLPQTLFSLELRQMARLAALPGSMATFFVRGRSQVNICLMENISLGGVKLSGQPSHALELNDIIGPCTLSLAGKDALINREVTINKATVVRVTQQGKKQGLGLKFELSESEEQQLKEHLDFLSELKALGTG